MYLKRQNKSCSAEVNGEFGRYPMVIARYGRTIQHWCRMLNTAYISNLYKLLHLEDCFIGRIHYVNVKMFSYVFKQRVVDVFIKKWYVSLKRYPITKHII